MVLGEWLVSFWHKINSFTNTNTKNANSALGTMAADWLITVRPT